jgi:hypothetical protein
MFSKFGKVIPRFARYMAEANIKPPKVEAPKAGCGCGAPKKSCNCWPWIAGLTILSLGAFYYCYDCKKNGKKCCICTKICPQMCSKVCGKEACPAPEVKKPIEPAEKPSQKSA